MMGYVFIAGYLACKVKSHVARSWRQGKSIRETIVPARGDRPDKKIPRVSEVG